MKYLTVLDFNSGKVRQFEVDFRDINLEGGKVLSQHEQCEVFLSDEGFKLGNIEWMIHRDGRIHRD